MCKHRVLIFPANMRESKGLSQHAEMLGMDIVRASSIRNPEKIVNDVGDMLWLPYITERDFTEKFFYFLKSNSIDYIFTPNMGVYTFIKNIMASHQGKWKKLPKLCGPSPFEIIKEDLKDSLEWASIIIEDPLAEHIQDDALVGQRLNIYEYAALFRQFNQTPGQCDVEKLQTLCAIARLAPKGDVIEIGSLYGRSAQALASLADFYKIGVMIGVDPWSYEEACDQGADARIIATDAETLDIESIFKYYVSVASLQPNMSYIREPSIKAIEEYKKAAARRIHEAPYVRPVPVCGEISILHIDGNHSYDSVMHDVDTWLPYLKDSGWLLLDDYTWPFGVGPRECGDMLCQSGQFDLSFVVGDTLYLKKKKLIN